MAAFQGIHVHIVITCKTWRRVSDYQEIVSTTQTDRWTDVGQSNPYVLLSLLEIAFDKKKLRRLS